MEAAKNDQVSCRPAVVDAIVRLAQEERRRNPALDSSYLIWCAADNVKHQFPDVSEAEQQAAFSQINRTASVMQRAYQAALDMQIEHPEYGEVAAQLAGELAHESVRQ